SGRRVRRVALLQRVRRPNSTKGDRYAPFVVEDREGTVGAIAWPDTYRRFEHLVRGGEPVVVGGGLDLSPDRCQVIADDIQPLATARGEAIRQAHLRVQPPADREMLETLKAVLASHPGPCETFLHLLRPDDTEAVLALPSTIRIAASDDAVDAVENLLGVGAIAFRRPRTHLRPIPGVSAPSWSASTRREHSCR